MVLLSELDFDFDKQCYLYGIGFYRISDVNEAIKWISPLLKSKSNKELALDESELQNSRMMRRMIHFSGFVSLGFSFFFLYILIMVIKNFISNIKVGIGAFEEYLSVIIEVVLGCGMNLIAFIISVYIAYILFMYVEKV